MLVFDLDYTLWPFWVDTHVSAPLKATRSGLNVTDKWGESYGFYSDVGGVLAACREKGIIVAAASRTHAPALAKDMLKLLRIPGSGSGGGGGGEGQQGQGKKAIEYFDHMQIFPGSKIMHFGKLREVTGLPYEEMLFFDDESRNKEVETLGVVMRLVRDGVTREEVDEGVRSWRKRNRREHI